MTCQDLMTQLSYLVSSHQPAAAAHSHGRSQNEMSCFFLNPVREVSCSFIPHSMPSTWQAEVSILTVSCPGYLSIYLLLLVKETGSHSRTHFSVFLIQSFISHFLWEDPLSIILSENTIYLQQN